MTVSVSSGLVILINDKPKASCSCRVILVQILLGSRMEVFLFVYFDIWNYSGGRNFKTSNQCAATSSLCDNRHLSVDRMVDAIHSRGSIPLLIFRTRE